MGCLYIYLTWMNSWVWWDQLWAWESAAPPRQNDGNTEFWGWLQGGMGVFVFFFAGGAGGGSTKIWWVFGKFSVRLLAPTLIKWYLYVVFLLDFSHQTLEVFKVYSGLGIANLNWNCISSTTHRIHGKNGIFTYMMHFLGGIWSV